MTQREKDIVFYSLVAIVLFLGLYLMGGLFDSTSRYTD